MKRIACVLVSIALCIMAGPRASDPRAMLTGAWKSGLYSEFFIIEFIFGVNKTELTAA
jgi:hypothetical protein